MSITATQLSYWLATSASAAATAAAGAVPEEHFWLRTLLVASGVVVGTLARYPRWVDKDGEFIRHLCLRDLSAVGLLFFAGMAISVGTGWDPWFVGFSAGMVTLIGVSQLRLIAIDGVRTLVLNWANREGRGGKSDPQPDGDAP